MTMLPTLGLLYMANAFKSTPQGMGPLSMIMPDSRKAVTRTTLAAQPGAPPA